MIIEFAVTNFRSIKDRQVMDFRADGQIGNKQLVDNIALPKDRSYGNSLVKTVAIYGANASGKSNFLKALYALEFMVTNSDSFKLDKPIHTYEPFKLDKSSLNAPTIFEIEFIAKDKKRYRYEIHFNKTTILKEKLDVYELDKKATFPTLIFNRTEEKNIEWKEGKDFSLLSNQLLLSKAGTNDIPSIREAYRFFATYLFYAAAHSIFDEGMLRVTELILSDKTSENDKLKKLIISIIQAADTGIKNIYTSGLVQSTEEMTEEEKNTNTKRSTKRIKTVHSRYENGVEVDDTDFDLREESTGTMKLVGLAGIVAQALDDGSVIVMDELDKNLHPLLTRMIIGLFHNPDFNRKNAQLILSSHDISLIDNTLFRRDQIMLIDKDVLGKSSVKRLSDFTGISRVKQLEKWYMAGMFNAVPAINDYQIEMN
jgi:AAA15 family ATPase/GTPase